MPVTVQLPGYNRAAPAVGLAQVLGAGFNAYKDYKQGQEEESKTAGQDLQNQQTQMQLGAARNQMNQLNNLDPNGNPLGQDSPLTASLRAAGVAQIKGMEGAGLGDPSALENLKSVITDPTKTPTGIHVQQALSPLNNILELEKAKLSGGAQAKRAAAQEDSDARSVASGYHEQMTNYKNVNDDVKKIESILRQKDKDGNPVITKQAMAESNFAFNRLMSPGHISDAGLDATEYKSASGEFAGALQALSNNPKDTGARALVEHMIDASHRVANVSNQNALSQLDKIDAGNSSLTLDAARKAAKATSGQYRQTFGKQYPVVGESGSADHAIGTKQTYGGVTYTFKGGNWNDKKSWVADKQAANK